MKTLTFYSGKLWHSDKPFPVEPKEQNYTPELRDYQYPDDLVIYWDKVKLWLSTAYEVVNPEVIPEIQIIWEGDRLLVDGDELTLPDGYGVYTFGMPKRVCNITLPEKPTIPVPLFTAAPGFMTPSKQFYAHYKDGKFVIPPIEDHKPVGEKPENSAHGYTKLYEESGIITESQFIEMNRVEPSESQEEIKQLREWNEAHKETNKRLHDLMVDAEQRGERKGWNEAIEMVENRIKQMSNEVDDTYQVVILKVFTELKKLRK